MGVPLRFHRPRYSTETRSKFFWWPTKVWDCELQDDVTFWLESARVIVSRMGGTTRYTLWHQGHDNDFSEFTPEARRAFEELGIED